MVKYICTMRYLSYSNQIYPWHRDHDEEAKETTTMPEQNYASERRHS